jgi:hypothetical protein
MVGGVQSFLKERARTSRLAKSGDSNLAQRGVLVVEPAPCRDLVVLRQASPAA